MKIVEINTCDYGSTGKIMLQLADCARRYGHEVYTFSRKWKKNASKPGHAFIGFYFENILHHVLGPLTGFSECFSYFGTLSLIRKCKQIAPDIIHLHNLHGWYIHLPLLFRYIKRNRIRVIWTLHDCWAFTGHCPCFETTKCDKWKTGCHDCPSYREYPETYIDTSKTMWMLKKKWFSAVEDMTVVTPSKWLGELAKESFLQKHFIQVIHNGIDTSVFKATESSFRKKHNIPSDAKIVLGVAFGWGKRKGLDVFIELAKRLSDNYRIVLVGTDDSVDTQLPKNIISIHRTQNQVELAEIYTAADLFVNPTREDNYPTVNMESLACGTPVLTFQTGGSPEIIDETCGTVVNCNDVDALEKEIVRICETTPYTKESCVAHAASFDMYNRFKEYVTLYESRIHL